MQSAGSKLLIERNCIRATSPAIRRARTLGRAVAPPMITRDYNAEYKDGARKYAYRFDTVLRGYIMRTLDPFLPPGKALEMGCYTGDVTELIAARYADVTVIEASEELVAAAG